MTPVYVLHLGTIGDIKEEMADDYSIYFEPECLLLPIKSDYKIFMKNTNFGNICTINFSLNDKNLSYFLENSSRLSLFSNTMEIFTVEMAYFIEITYKDIFGDNIKSTYFCKPNLKYDLVGEYVKGMDSGDECFYKLNDIPEMEQLYQEFLDESCVYLNKFEAEKVGFKSNFIEMCESAIENEQWYPIASY